MDWLNNVVFAIEYPNLSFIFSYPSTFKKPIQKYEINDDSKECFLAIMTYNH